MTDLAPIARRSVRKLDLNHLLAIDLSIRSVFDLPRLEDFAAMVDGLESEATVVEPGGGNPTE